MKKVVLSVFLVYAQAFGVAEGTEFKVTKGSINEVGAEQVIAAAERQAVLLHAPCAIAVVNESGTLVMFKMMDGVRSGSPELAIGKARTSALLERPSAEVEDNVNGGRTAFVTAGFMALRGGVPLLSGGRTVGAVGVAGLNKDNDVAIAEAAGKAYSNLVDTVRAAH